MTEKVDLRKSLWALCVMFLIILSTKKVYASSGTCGDHLTWTLENGVLTISGTGEMANYRNDYNVPWYAERDSITTVVIDEGVKTIGGGAFWFCSNITDVTIPSSVVSIGEYAFSYCTNLTNVTIPNSVKYIYGSAFYGCSSLTGVIIPDSVIHIGSHAFYMCRSLTNIMIPSSVNNIDIGAFGYDDNLVEINVHQNNPNYCSVDGILFNKDKSKILGFPAGKTARSYTIPHGVSRIEDYAFTGCVNLVSVEISEGVNTIGESSFFDCSNLTSVTIPNSVYYIQARVFLLTNLTDVYYDGTAAQWQEVIIDSVGAEPLLSARFHFLDNTSANLPESTLTLPFEKDTSRTNVSFKWSLGYLTNIGDRNRSLAIAGLLLSQDAYSGEAAVIDRMQALGLLDGASNGRYDLLDSIDHTAMTGCSLFVGVKTITVGNQNYNIITGVAGGNTPTVQEWSRDLFWSRGFFKERGDQFYSLIERALTEKGISISDPNNRFFITGHSLGGAASNYVSNKLLENRVGKEQIACYTYGSPLTCRKPSDIRSDAHIYNYIGTKDWFSTVGQATNLSGIGEILPAVDRYGNDIKMEYGTEFAKAYRNLYGLGWTHSVTNGILDGSTAGNLKYGGTYHGLDVYLAQIIAADNYVTYLPAGSNYREIMVLCPVNVYVYDQADNLVACIENDTVIREGNDDVAVATMGDKKFLVIKNDKDYTVKLVATAAGTMEYIVKKDSGAGGASEAKIFTDVALEAGKQMVSVIKADQPIQAASLFVTDSNQEAIREISTSGTESRHTHSYQWAYDNSSHWHECACGRKSDTAVAHTWGSGDICTVCGKRNSKQLPNTVLRDDIVLHLTIFLMLFSLSVGIYWWRKKTRGFGKS